MEETPQIFERTVICSVVFVFSLSLSGGQDFTDMELQNLTESKKLIDWNRPLTFTHLIDSNDPRGTVVGGIILTLMIVVGLALMTGIIVIVQYSKGRCQKDSSKYGRLYNDNITSVENGIKKV